MTTLSTPDFVKISPTALLVAYARQLSDIPYTQEIAALSNVAAIADQFTGPGQQRLVMMAAVVEVRYKAIEQVRSRFNHTQILEMASGLLPRA